MDKMRLGRTGLQIGRTGFGALPIQRVTLEEADTILRTAYDRGIDFFDTARGYTDSEEKIGRALSEVRGSITIATKSGAADKDGLLNDLETSLKNLKTDHVDILQLHGPKELPHRDDPDSAYAGLLEAREKGLTRFVGLTSHRLPNAMAAASSGDYDTIQFPLSAMSSSEDLALIDECRKHDVGVIAMKAMCGGLLTNAVAAFAFLRQFDNLVPIWGIQKMTELDEFLALEESPPPLDDEMLATLESDRKELSGNYCRGCGYCLPCPAEIPIPMAARMTFLLRRAPTKTFLSEEWQEKMKRIEDCEKCGQCAERCPYELDPPVLLKGMYEDYKGFLAERE